MAQVRGNAFVAVTLGLLLALQCRCISSATTWTVGDASGWNVGVDYTTWASGKAFKTGDTLFFPYLQTEHNVVVVKKSEYDSCSPSSGDLTYTDGNTNVTLNAAGTQYYLCSIPSHCSSGMKLAVTVVAATPAPAPSTTTKAPAHAPSTTTKAPPAPAPSTTTKTPPAPAPSTATKAPLSSPTPSPATTPASAPASTKTPASAPTPSPSQSPASAPAPPVSSAQPPSTGSAAPAPPPSSAPSLLTTASAIATLLGLATALLAL